MVIRKKMLPMLKPKMTPEISSCVSIMALSLPSSSAAARCARNEHLFSSGSSVPQMPFSPASMMKTSKKPMNSSQLPISLADQVLHAGVGDRADDRSVERADAAEDRHHDRIGGAGRRWSSPG